MVIVASVGTGESSSRCRPNITRCLASGGTVGQASLSALASSSRLSIRSALTEWMNLGPPAVIAGHSGRKSRISHSGCSQSTGPKTTESPQ